MDADAVDGVQAVDHDVPPLPQRGQNLAGTGLVTLQGLHAGVLDEPAGARLVVGVQPGDQIDDAGRADRGAKPPAGHRVRLGEGVADHGALDHLRFGHQAAAAAAVADVEVRLVGQHPQVALAGDPGQPGDLVGRCVGAGGVVLAVDDQHAGRVAERRFHRSAVDAEAVGLLDVGVGASASPQVVDLRLVDRVPGGGVHHFLAGIHHAHQQLADDRLGPRLHRDVLGAVAHAARPPDLHRQRLAQLRDAGSRRIAGLAVPHGPLRGLDDVDGGAQVDVAQVKRIDAVALRRPRRRVGRDRERGLGAQPAHRRRRRPRLTRRR